MIQFASAILLPPLSLFPPPFRPPLATLEHIFGKLQCVPALARRHSRSVSTRALLTAIVCSLPPPTPPVARGENFPLTALSRWGCNFYFRSRSSAFRLLRRSQERVSANPERWWARERTRFNSRGSIFGLVNYCCIYTRAAPTL